MPSNAAPNGDRSLDRLVGAGQDRGRDGETNFLCSLHIDDHLDHRRQFDRDVPGGNSGCDSLYEIGDACKSFFHVRAVTQQSTRLAIVPPSEGAWQLLALRVL